MIEARPQVVQRFSQNDSVLRSWFRRCGAVFQCPIGLQMESGRCRGTFRVSTEAECGFEVIEMHFGPVQLCQDGQYRFGGARCH